MKQYNIHDLSIRNAVARNSNIGFILAADTQKEQDEESHAVLFLWKSGAFIQGYATYNAHSNCLIDKPEFGLFRLSGSGVYSFETVNGADTSNIFDEIPKTSKDPRYGDFRMVNEIGGMGYACGFGGMACRFVQKNKWEPIDASLPDSFDIEAIHGFGPSDIYAVGFKGEVWHYDGASWTKIDVPTNVVLTCVKCAQDGMVYIGGHKGLLLKGKGNAWQVIYQDETEDDIWDLEWFDDSLWISTLSGAYRLSGTQLIPVDFGDDPPRTTYKLSAAKDVLWSIGEKDIVSFDGKAWSRVV